MDKFLELPFWLSVTLGVVYGVVWLSFLVVLYSSYRRYHRRHQRVTTQHYGEGLATDKSGAFDSTMADQSESVYDDDDD